MPRSSLPTVSSSSLTRMAETLGKASVTAFDSCSSSAGVATRTVAIWVCGAASSAPGENSVKKLMPRPVQSIWRRLAIRPVTSRPATSKPMVSPSFRCIPRAMPWSSETSGGPL